MANNNSKLDMFSSIGKQTLKEGKKLNTEIIDLNEDEDTTISSASGTKHNDTSKCIKDIDINLIDIYEKNERLFGYNNLDHVKNSLKNTEAKSVEIHVFEKENGRYLVYSGNTRLKALKVMGKKKVTCIIDGPVPEEDELDLMVIASNVQRDNDPYHLAHQIERLTNIFKSKDGLSGDSLYTKIKEYTGIGKSAQNQYTQIFKYSEEIQLLFDDPNVSFRKLLDVLKKVPNHKYREFAQVYRAKKETAADSIMTSEKIIEVYNIVMFNDAKSDTANNVKPRKFKISSYCPNIKAVICNDDGTFTVDSSKKEATLQEIQRLREQLELIEAACNEA